MLFRLVLVVGADEVSAGSDPNDWTELERWPPMRDGAAGDDESNGFGESTDPNARGPICMSAIRSEHVGLPLPSWRGAVGEQRERRRMDG
jgi:hypothetical protein